MPIRHHNQWSNELTELPVINELNTQYAGIPKRSIWNTTSATDGLIYFLIPSSGTSFSVTTFKLIVCDMNHILNEFSITTRGTYGNGGAVTNGHLGIFTNTGNIGYYVYCWTYNASTNTLTAGMQISTGRNHLLDSYYAFTHSDGYNYICTTLNRTYNSLTLVNMDTGAVRANEHGFHDYVMLFYNNSGDSSYPFLGTALTSRPLGSRPLSIRKYSFPPTYDGVEISNNLANTNFPEYWYCPVIKFYDIDDYFFINLQNTSWGSRIYTMKGVFNHIEITSAAPPSGYGMTYMNLASGYMYLQNSTTRLFERFKIADYFNW